MHTPSPNPLRCCLLFAVLLLLPGISLAQQDLFDQATQELLEGDLDKARVLYRDLERRGYHAPELFWNQGVAALESDSLGLAIYYFMRAGQFRSHTEEARNVVERLRDQLPRRSALLPPHPLQQLSTQLREFPGAQGLIWISILLLHLALLFWALHRFSILPAGVRFLTLSLAITAVIAGGISTTLHWKETRIATGIFVGDQAPVFQDNNPDSPVIATLYEGYRVTLQAPTPSADALWPVRLENGRTGWVRPEQIRTFNGRP